ncbi:metallophosphoesterase family protein [Chloroflexota bacterium]
MWYTSLSERDEVLVGLLSDTHLLWGSDLPPQIHEVFADVDFILHGGDIYELQVLDELECTAPVLAAQGDDDCFKRHDNRVKGDYFLTFANQRLWLKHTMPWGLIQMLDAERDDELVELVGRHCDGVPDIVVFGDTHRAIVKQCGGMLFINPGSPTWPRHVRKLGTVGLLTVSAGGAVAHLVQLE